jgi:predicted chitinase
MADPATSGNILTTLLLCGLMGLLGQGIRAAVGLKSSSRLPSAQADQQTAFSAAYFVLSLMIGFIAGVVAGLVIGVQKLLTIDPSDLKILLGIVASGYAGADFIENSLSIVIPAANAPAVHGPGAATTPQPVNLQPDLAAFNANTAALTSAVHKLATMSPQATPISLLAALPVIAGTVPTFGPALHRVAPGIDRTKWEAALTQGFQKFALTSNQRIAAAIGQFIVEAGESFEEVVENMSYSAPRMMAVWPKTFKTEADAEPYVHQPEKLGNFIYANKLGNGNEASGDGYRFRGRGLIQLTGRSEYGEFGAAIGMTAEQVSDYCETPEGAAISGCWYLSSRGCLPFADSWNLAEITRRVNGRKMQDHAKRVKFSNAMLTELNKPN